MTHSSEPIEGIHQDTSCPWFSVLLFSTGPWYPPLPYSKCSFPETTPVECPLLAFWPCLARGDAVWSRTSSTSTNALPHQGCGVD
jgi:hypothetical protein